MEATMLTVDRLVDGMHGEDPGGARLYMSQIRENETLSMLECFEDMLSGRLPVAPPNSSPDSIPLSGSSGGSMAYRIPPSDFLKVLVEGNTTRVGALHAVMQAIGRGDLQGRAASLCVSEVRMCLSACADSTGKVDGDRRSTSFIHRRIPLAQLRELAGVCLSFSMDIQSGTGYPAPGVYAGGRRGAEDANNRRVLMLQALPAVLGACCAVAAAEEEEEEDSDDNDEIGDSSEPDSDNEEDGEEQPIAMAVRGEGSLGTATGGAGAGAAAGGKRRKGKGKSSGNYEKGHRRSLKKGASNSVLYHASVGVSTGVGGRSRSGNVIGGGGMDCGGGCMSQGVLPQRGEAILRNVVDALLDRPWPLRLALPLLVVFEEIYNLVELLECHAHEARRPAPESGCGASLGKESVWTRVRARLMELVWMGGLDGADFTGVVRQVCVFCDITDGRRDYEHDARHFPPTIRVELSVCDVAAKAAAAQQVAESLMPRNELTKRMEKGGGIGGVQNAQRSEQTGDSTSRSGSWLSCLRQLYAAVPPEWVSTVELVLEQTLHQMPGVAESLLDAIQNTCSSNRDGGKADDDDVAHPVTGSSRTKRPRRSSGLPSLPPDTLLRRRTLTSIGNDLALLVLLLREASPLRACSLPLLPVGVDRGRRAEEGIRSLLLDSARHVNGFEGRKRGGNDQKAECRGREGALDSTRALLRVVLCSEPGCGGSSDSSCGGGGYRGRGGGGDASGSVFSIGEGQSNGVVSERASQLLELGLRWLEEGDGGTGGDGGDMFGKEGGGTEFNIQDIASETISAVFDAVAAARPRLLRALLSGMFDKNQGGVASSWNYMRAWEALMAQEAEQECRRLTPYSHSVSDSLGQLTLLPRVKARRVVQSMLPLADVCPTQASALMSLCRKCSVQGESKGRLLTLHAVTCILAWNARRGNSRRNGGCLDQEGMQEDLVGMFRRAFEGGLQTAARADALHLLATKLATPAVGASTHGTRHSTQLVLPTAPLQVPPRAVVDMEPPIDLTALNGLRKFLAMRLFRFFAHKDEVLGGDSSTVGENDGDDSAGAGHYSGYRADSLSRRKGKQKARRRRGGRFQLVPLRLLEERVACGKGHNFSGNQSGGRGDGVMQNFRGRGVVPRDAIGQLLKCCWALVPVLDGSTETHAPDGERGRVVSGPGKRAEAEAIARAVLGTRSRRRGGGGGGGEGGGGGKPVTGVSESGVRTREGEALLAVVEFLQGGGSMETLRMVAPSNQQTPAEQGADDFFLPAAPPPPCHPWVVTPLTALGVVVTLAEALVDCLLSGISYPPTVQDMRHPSHGAVSQAKTVDGHHVEGGGGGPPPEKHEQPLALWAIADVFTLLAAATRAADGIAVRAGGISKLLEARAPEGLSELITSLPAETLGLSFACEMNTTAVGAGEGDNSDGCGASGERDGTTGGKRKGGAGGDAMGQSSLLSASSALVFIEEFLGWAAKEKCKNPAALVAEGWDGGIGVWLGLIHSVQSLARALKTTRGSRRGGIGEVSVEGKASQQNGPSAEAVALAVFQLRAVVGTPSAALCALEPSAAPTKTPISSNEYSPGATSSSAGNNTARGMDDTDSPVVDGASCRPPPGAMITGFLTNMSVRWKAALPWGLPSAAPPRRTSVRLECKSNRRCGGGYGVPGDLKAEAEDLFFALRSELLRSERLVLSILLVGSNAGVARRTWTMQAALVSARPRCGGETVEGRRSPSPSTSRPPRADANGVADSSHAFLSREEPPESGSGAARRVTTGDVRPVLRKALAGGGNDSSAKAMEEGGLAGAESGREDGEGGMWDGLGSLCRLAAAEMREGLETGLSVKLSHAYLDLIELLGSAALEHRCYARRTSRTNTTSFPDHIIRDGEGNDEDAGSVLLSIVTCHTVTQPTLFKRVIRGALQLDGIGANHRIQASRPTAIILAELQARDQEISQTTNPDRGEGISRIGGNGKNGVGALLTMAKSPPPPLKRSARLLVHCVRWIRVRHENKSHRTAIAHEKIEEDGTQSSEEEDARDNGTGRDIGLPDGQADFGEDRGSNDLHNRDWAHCRYSLSPEEVKFASSRECFAAMHTALVECETALSSAGGFDVAGVGASSSNSSSNNNLADILATVAFGLREFFAHDKTTTRTTMSTGKQKTATRTRRESEPDDNSSPGSPSAAISLAECPASTPNPAAQRQRGERKKSGSKDTKDTAGDASPVAAVGMFPDAIKLLLMRVVERLCLVGKGAAVSAAAVLANPSSAAIATVVTVQSASLTPPPSPCPSPPLPKRRRQQSVTSDGRPSDQAEGTPAKTPAKRGATTATDRSDERGVAKERGSGSGPCTAPSRSFSTTPARKDKRTQQGNDRTRADAASGARSKLSTPAQQIGLPKVPEERLDPVLASVLPAVALASGDCLQLMWAARIWAEALRLKTRRGGDDPCRKRASTMLFKIERCELEIGATAHKTRQFLEYLEEGAKSSTVQAETRSSGGGGAKKRLRGCARNNGVGGGGNAPARRGPGTTSISCDEKLESALRLILSGADVIAAWRRDSAAKEKSSAALPQNGSKSSQARTQQQGRGAATAHDQGEEGETEVRSNSARERISGASGKRKRSRGARVRSRNMVIDGWLEEGGEEGGGREDAFVDLEDFIEA